MTPEQIREQLDVFAGYLKENGLRMTRQRQVVAECFLENDGHLSTDELFELVRSRNRRVGYATVFRTLKSLSECGIAREMTFNDGVTRFEHVYKHPHHHHIICVECNRAIEFVMPEWETMHERVVSEYGFKPISHSANIFGICPDCQAKKEGKPTDFDSDLVFARDALRIAMETEKRGVNFYTTAAGIVKTPSTRRAFRAMLKEEKKHYRELEKQWKALVAKSPEVLEAPVFLHFDYKALDKIFPSRAQVRKKLNKDLTAPEALRLAMNMERDAHNFFKRYAERFNETRGREIFLQFAGEEQEHYQLMRSELEALEGD